MVCKGGGGFARGEEGLQGGGGLARGRRVSKGEEG